MFSLRKSQQDTMDAVKHRGGSRICDWQRHEEASRVEASETPRG